MLVSTYNEYDHRVLLHLTDISSSLHSAGGDVESSKHQEFVTSASLTTTWANEHFSKAVNQGEINLMSEITLFILSEY